MVGIGYSPGEGKMTDRAYNIEFFRTWIRDKRMNLGLDEEEFAERVGESVATVVMWEVGNTRWAVLPKDVKNKIEATFGKFPVNEIPIVQAYREAIGTAYLPEIKKQIEQEFPETWCSKCGAAVRIKDDGWCSKCGRPVDGSH